MVMNVKITPLHLIIKGDKVTNIFSVIVQSLLYLQPFSGNIDMFILLVSFYIIFVISIQNAFAYLDPGTGTIITQVLMAAFGGLVIFWSRIKLFFLSFMKKNKKNDDY
jgi:hypothetical protein